MSKGDFLELNARAKIGESEDWLVFRFDYKECPLGEYYEVTGARTPLFLKGVKKGKPNWKMRDRSTERTVALTIDEHEQFVKDWEQRTGLCSICKGSGKQWIGWAIDSGHKYRQCKCGTVPTEQLNLLGAQL